VSALANLAFIAMLLAGLAAGGRLLATASQTRRDPELWIGLAVLFAALGGAIDTASMYVFRSGGEGDAFAVQGTARLIYTVGSSALGVGIWRVFRPDRVWAGTLASSSALLLASCWGAWMAGGQHSLATGPTIWSSLFNAGRGIAFAWGAVESFVYWRRMRRRLRLGLADPVITHQFLLWGIASTSMLGLLAVVLVTYHVIGRSPFEWNPGLLAASCFGTAAAATIYTAFFPPGFYRRRILARAATGS
jgi:hypothetical protein